MNKVGIFWNMLLDITAGIYRTLYHIIVHSAQPMAKSLRLGLVYVMYFIGKDVGAGVQEYSVTGVIVLPIVVYLFTYYIIELTERNNAGSRVPVPAKRFTEIDHDGEVNVESSRLQEMILFVADVEEWLRKKGML